MTSRRAAPGAASSFAVGPCCTMLPSLDSTATASQRLTTSGLCVTTIVVGLPGRGASTASVTAAAVAASRPLVGSSKTSTGAGLTSARASATRCRSPPDSSWPPQPTEEA
mmetsp:Transcript_32328/g.86799  ORF Transcript_32328/g.86799 Transcript_32328/m.86799 type:complete len:110 (+) Transcript_32328:314-643(+)